MSETSQTTTAPAEIVELVQRFRDQQSAYRAGKYNETQLRRDFLDPLFEALGWDVSNRKNYSEKYREVVHELSVEIEGQAKAADYAFQTGGAIHFLLEAKKPAVNIETNPEPAFQIRRYGWSAKVPVGVLSDFEQLAVYDCRTRPVHGDPAHKDRARLFHFSEYVEKWAELHQLLSHQAVHQGSLDQFIQAQKGKRGTADVDDAFLLEMERWREELARNIALRNPGLSQYELNSAVQTTIDRLIFLRICEDRGIEPENALREATDGKEVYSDLLELFRRADRKYNSGLFHFEEEKGQPSYPDRLTPTIKIDDRVLKDILANLYYPRSPYAFKYIPADILGQVYERFLGKVIRLTAGHQARVEEKPEVRKAGGVYYTPTYIVDYIVKNTLGELLKTRDPESLAENPLRVLDPACGSGSFLLGAYQYLLDWHLDWYSANDPARWARGKTPPVYESRGGWALSMEKKKEILTRHIFGVDIDPQAVEVTKLSLLLKVVENPGQLSLLGERILPDLGRNIQCGNSLIGPDYYEGRQLAMFDSEEQRRVNAFDWRSAFPQVFAAGGFDAVIGNPPYIRIQALKEWAPTEVEYYKAAYKSATRGNYDIYVVFVEKGLEILKVKGKLGFILPHKFMNAQYGEPIRRIISRGKHLSRIIHFGDQQVFDGATTYTCLIFLDNEVLPSIEFEKVKNLETWRPSQKGHLNSIDSDTLSEAEWNFNSDTDSALFEKMKAMPVKLGDISKMFVGLQTSADTVFLFKEHEQVGDMFSVYSKALSEKVYIEKELLKPVIRSGEIGRYWARPTAYVLFPYEKLRGKSQLLVESKLQSTYPNIYRYLQRNKKLLIEREHGKFKDSGWYQLYPKNLDVWEQPKIMMPYMITRLSAYYDEQNYYFVNVTTGGFGLIIDTSIGSQKYAVGLLNSTLLNWYFKRVSSSFHGGYYGANKQYLVQLPIRTIDFSKPNEVQLHDHITSLVDYIMASHKMYPSTPIEQERLQRQIEAADRQIDRLVYELYGLSEDEIRVVEGG